MKFGNNLFIQIKVIFHNFVEKPIWVTLTTDILTQKLTGVSVCDERYISLEIVASIRLEFFYRNKINL